MGPRRYILLQLRVHWRCKDDAYHFGDVVGTSRKGGSYVHADDEKMLSTAFSRVNHKPIIFRKK